MQFDYPTNICFDCNKCGLCCGDTENKIRHIILLKSDAQRISVFTGQAIKQFAFKISGYKPYVYEMQKNLETKKCIFLKKNKCTIYKQRPLICRFYPFELRQEKNGKAIFKNTSECPGIKNNNCSDNKNTLNEKFFKELLELAQLDLDNSIN